jgi:hypothetical protein
MFGICPLGRNRCLESIRITSSELSYRHLAGFNITPNGRGYRTIAIAARQGQPSPGGRREYSRRLLLIMTRRLPAKGVASTVVELAPIRTGPSSPGCIERATLTLWDWGFLGTVERSAH